MTIENTFGSSIYREDIHITIIFNLNSVIDFIKITRYINYDYIITMSEFQIEVFDTIYRGCYGIVLAKHIVHFEEQRIQKAGLPHAS